MNATQNPPRLATLPTADGPRAYDLTGLSTRQRMALRGMALEGYRLHLGTEPRLRTGRGPWTLAYGHPDEPGVVYAATIAPDGTISHHGRSRKTY